MVFTGTDKAIVSFQNDNLLSIEEVDMKKSLILILTALLAVVGPAGTAFAQEAGLKDGVYTAVGQGKDGPITVETTVTSSKIAAVRVVSQRETAGVSDAALVRIPQAVVAGQTLEVDAVTGATYTGKGILEAVEKAILQAGGDPSAFRIKRAAEAKALVTLSTDVVVVGAGGAGASAAVAAAEGGAKVIVLEKAGQPGGATLMSSGLFASDSKLQAQAGLKVPTAEIYKKWQDYVNWLNDPVLTWNFFKKSASTVDWLQERGYQLKLVPNVQKVHASDYQTYHAYADESKKMEYLQTFLANVTKRGGQVYYETRATKLITENGKVVGVEARQADGTPLRITAQAVVLATGGFGANAVEVAKVNPGKKMSALNSGTQTGDGAAMAREVGAGGAKTEFSHYHGVDMPFEIIGAAVNSGDGSKGATGGIDSVNHFANFPGGLWVSRAGVRFAPETIAFDSALVANVTYSVGGEYYVVVDSKTFRALEARGASGVGVPLSPERLAGFELAPVKTPWKGLSSQFETAVKLGGAFRGQTVADLARAMGVEAASLEATVAAYNKVCAAKKDEQYGKAPAYLVPVVEGPFYAVLGRAVALGGLGGILTDDKLRVTTEDGRVIPGLFAAGADVSRIYNNVYPLVEGVTAGWAFNSGRMAGESVLAALRP